MIDFSCPVQDEEINAFIDEILAGDKEDEIAFRGKRRYINKLERISPESIAQRARKSVPAAGSNYTTTIADQDMLDNFVIRETVCPMPGDDEIKVEVKAASLNFRDIMLGMGLLSDAAAEGGLLGKSLGADCAGVVTAVGKNVKDVKIGDEVLGIASSCFSGSTILKVSHVAQKPKNISFEQAASLPVVYSTAHYALMHLCRMQEGDRVLIHSASGGVGTAAVRIAHAVGAEVYATVSNQEKRDYVESMGVSPEHIFDSRTLEFADGIMESTKGKGIDIVLNTLSGEAIYKSIRCLAPLGRFVDLTKTDIYRNSKLGLRPFRNNLSYFAVDLDRLCIQKERYSGMLFREAMDFLFQNDLPFHPIEVFPISQIGDAFQLMARSGHIGKIVISMTGDVQMAPPKEIRFKEDGTYMITGGCSGFGLAVANWMTKKGAKHLVLMSRSGPRTDEDEKVIEEMKGRNVQVVIAKGDVSAKEDVNRIVADIKKNMPTLKGIQHAAMVLDDGIVPDMDCERYMKVFRPKAIGCWLLHEATRDMGLDHFVLHSSLCSIIGNPGQVNYVAASHFLDSFSYFRRVQGLPSIAINWGVLGDIGYIARNREIGKLLSKRSWRMFSLKQSTDILEQVLLTNPVQIVASDLDWQMLGESLAHFSETSRFSHLAREEEMTFSPRRDSGPANLKAELLELSHQERLDILTVQIRDIFAKVLGTTTDSLDTTEPVTRYGLDSLMAGQISNWIHRRVSIDYKMMRILEGPTLEEMARDISQEFDEQVGISGQGVYELDKCIIRTKKVRKPGLRLFCFPYFGGDASVYGSWHKSLPDNIEVCAVQYPGREERSNEKPFNDISELTRMTAEVIEPLLDCPIAFYGHSFGAAHAFELTRYLREKNGIQPVVFIVGAWRAQHLGIPPEFMEAASIIDSIDDDGICKDENISRIIYQLRTIGFPESVLDHTLQVLGNRRLTDEILPAVRADIPLIKRYRYRESEPFSCPIVAIAGRNDTIVSEEEVEQWEKHTTGGFHFSTVNAGHLFCIDNRGELPGLIAKELNELGMLHLQNPQPIASFQHLGG